MSRNIAIILSGGIGNRFQNNQNIPKQYIIIEGKTIIEHTIAIFQQNNLIDEIAIVADPAYHEKIQSYIDKNQFNKVKKILCNGVTRNHSTLSAIEGYKHQAENVNFIVHDAVRPLLEQQTLSDCIEALKTYNAITVAFPSTDTIIEKNPISNTINSVLKRDILYNVQTPQCFYLPTLIKAYDIALKECNLFASDDCGIIKKYLPNEKIYIVQGSHANIKITYQSDLLYFKFNIKSQNNLS